MFSFFLDNSAIFIHCVNFEQNTYLLPNKCKYKDLFLVKVKLYIQKINGIESKLNVHI
jgi:hypothetical protein